ncbi:serine-protein kinase ATM-like isoform X2 [Ostrea edulis]|uniref:serine-protein kinase ATM-like isoform X2 n=1 Tax=Ostrea edulis TaxID=37623 RepID=UPI0024AEE778|nr:serine-protein kinase ATM-like isoform X2 [Ostrea edulis]
MDSLSDVFGCCRELSSDKATERKKSLEKLKNLLNKTTVINSLDYNSQIRTRDRNTLTWDDILREVHSYIYLETQLFQKGKEPQTSTARASKEKRKQEIGGVFKFVVKQAENRGPNLKASQLIKQILEVLKDAFMMSAYGLDYSSILLKNVLPVRKYCTEITDKTWHEMINLYCKLFMDPECGLDKILLSRIIHSLMSAAIVRCDLRPKKLLTFFKEVFKDIRCEKRMAVIEHLIMAANTFVYSVAANSRAQVCKFGESICVNMLYLWENKPSNILKEEIQVFLRLQMTAHHPGGARRDECGSYAYDWDDWQSFLRKLYEFFYTDLQKQNNRSRFSSSSREASLAANYVELVVDVCNQIFLEKVNSIDVTQISTQQGQGTKKRRLESGWCYVLEFLLNREQQIQMIPWIQMVTRFLQKYPQNFPQDQVISYLEAIANQLGDFKRVEVIHHLMLCAKSFIKVWNTFSEVSEGGEVLKKISLAALRCISVHQADDSAYQLLTSMVQQGLEIEQEMWNAFIPSITRPSTRAVQYLNTYLTRYKIPEQYKHHLTSLLTQSSEADGKNYHLRKQLLDWLFPRRSQYLNVTLGTVNESKADPREIGHLIALLLSRNQCDVPNYCCSLNQDHGDAFYTDLENMYLQSSNKFEIEKEQTVKESSDSCHVECNFLCDIYNHVMDLLKDESTFLNEVTDCDMKHLDSLSWLICVAGNIFKWLMKYKILPENAVEMSELNKCIKLLLKKLGGNVKLLTSSENYSMSLRILTNLQKILITENDLKLEGEYFVAMKLRSLVPACILEEFMSVLTEKGRKLDGDRNLRTDLSDVIHGVEDFDMEGSTQNDDQNDDFMSDDFAELEESDVTGSDGNDMKSILDENQLTEKQKLHIEMIKTLCFWCGFDNPEHRRKASIKMDVDQSFIKAKLVKWMESVDVHKSFSLVQLRVMIKILSSSYQHVSEENLNSMIRVVRFVAKTYRQDQEVCFLCLELLCNLIPHLQSGEDMVSQSVRESRDAALILLSAFLNLPYDKCTEKMRLGMAKCIVQFMKADPNQSWAGISLKRDDGATEKIPVFKEFIKYLGDLSHAIRMDCALAVQEVFVCKGIPCDRVAQDQSFDAIYKEIMELLDLQDNLSLERAMDERNNREASALVTLAYIVCASPVCEKKALFAFCQLTKARHVEAEKIKMILQKLAKVQGYESGGSYVKTYLPYMIHQWLCVQYSMEEFPFQVAFCHSKENFYSKHYEILISELIMFKDVETAKKVGMTVSSDWQKVLILCIPRVVVFILPQFAASRSGETSNEQVKKRTAHATACYDLLAEQATKEVVNKCIVTKLDVIVVNILLCLYDCEEDEFIKTPVIRNLDPEPNPPCYNLYKTQSTLDYLTSSFSGNKSLIEILSRTQDSLQKILQELALRLFTDHRLHEKRRVLLMYRLICKLMLQDFDGGLGGSFVFILREIIYRLVYLVQEMRKQDSIRDEDRYANNISCMGLELLYDVLKSATAVSAPEVEKYLKFIINNLVPLTELSPLLCEQVKNLFKMLILESRCLLKAGIASLDPFPDREDFHQFSTVYREIKLAQGPITLQQIIENYLSEDEKMLSEEHSKEGLHFLSRELASRMEELSELMRSEQGKSKSVLSFLMMKLVRHSQLVKDTQALREITQCLGIMGPVDLMVLALPCPDQEDKGKIDSFVWVLEHLDKYLIDKDMKTVEATSQVLKSMLRSSAGINFVNEMNNSNKMELFQRLQPFLPKKKDSAVNAEIQKMSYDKFVSAINQDDLWWDTTVSHEDWIVRLTSTLLTCSAINNELFCYLGPVCLLKMEFCEFLLPMLIHDILSLNNAAHQEIFSQQVSRFFLQHCRLSLTQPQGSYSICQDKESIRTMLGVIQYLRQETRPQQGRKPLSIWDNNFWLDVNYLHIAKAALFCSSQFSTVMYAEIWCNCQRKQQEETLKKSSTLYETISQSFTQDSQVDSMSSDSEGVTLNVQDILLEAYRQIGDPDGVYGCGAGRLADPVSRIRMYEHEGQWAKAVITYDIGLQQHSKQEVDLLKALDSFGSQHLLDSYLENYHKSKSDEIRNLIFMSAIKVGKWDLNIEESAISDVYSFNESMYRALCSLKDSQFSLVSSFLDIARKNTIKRLQEASVESCRCLYPVLSDLQCVSQIDQAVKALTSPEGIEDMLKDWSQEMFSSNEFEYVEPIHNFRCSVLQVLPNQSDSMQKCMLRELLHLTRIAVQSNRYLIAERVVSRLNSYETSDFNLQVDKVTEEAKLFWVRGEQNIAKHMIKKLLKMLEQKQNSSIEVAKLYPRVLSLYGNWLAETHAANPNIIMEEYLEKTVALLENLKEEGDLILDAYLSLARFADSQYQHIVNYMKSSIFEAKQILMIKAKKEMARMQQLGEKEIKKDRYYTTLSKQSQIDQSELDALEEDRTRFLKQAVQNYIKCLKHGDKHDIRIFRLVSLWFSNPSSAEICGLIWINIQSIKSYKFLSLIYQLCARMDTNPPADQTSSLQKTLSKIIHRTAVDHPHHALFCIFALANAKRDSELLKKSTASKSRLSKNGDSIDSGNEGRIEAAKKLIIQMKSDRDIGDIVNKMEKLCDAYIQLANYNVAQYRHETKPITLDKRLWIMQLNEIGNVAVPTDYIPIDPSGDYKSIVTVNGFEPTFKLAGGINLPKIITCVGSDGKGRRQLVKGRDDLRQDAIMQQVFEMLNTLLHKNPETRKRNLTVRQYKVIPLSQCSGVLEWCEGTLPLGMYLIGDKDESKGAHKRFRSHDTGARASRDKMAETVGASMKVKLKNFLEICSKFQPVMRYFFMEKFSQPSVWFERRLAYTKSVSTTSIVGYILGLGDRHMQNILIDTDSAELVHIDLGIAFEQGRILPTPETVPFRLTRDIVDGMGVCGVEGTFRRCCEKTMEVMHNNQEALLTILEVLLYDPLNHWTISPQKAAALQSRRDRLDTETLELNATKDILTDIDEANTSVQQDSQESVNKLAERVLLRLQQKLQGYEEGVQLSVAGQVNSIIQEARDPKNLCRLFPGWQPYI